MLKLNRISSEKELIYQNMHGKGCQDIKVETADGYPTGNIFVKKDNSDSYETLSLFNPTYIRVLIRATMDLLAG